MGKGIFALFDFLNNDGDVPVFMVAEMMLDRKALSIISYSIMEW